MQGSVEPGQEQLGFVRMATMQQAEQLVDHLHGRQIDSHTLSVTVLHSQPWTLIGWVGLSGTL